MPLIITILFCFFISSSKIMLDLNISSQCQKPLSVSDSIQNESSMQHHWTPYSSAKQDRKLSTVLSAHKKTKTHLFEHQSELVQILPAHQSPSWSAWISAYKPLNTVVCACPDCNTNISLNRTQDSVFCIPDTKPSFWAYKHGKRSIRLTRRINFQWYAAWGRWFK